MSIKYNALTFTNKYGVTKSTSDFPFNIFVSENAGLSIAKSNATLVESQFTQDATLIEDDTYKARQRTYTLLFREVDKRLINQFLLHFQAPGQLTEFRDDRVYDVLHVDWSDSNFDGETGFYEIQVTFTCRAFSYLRDEQPLVFTSNGTINNDTGLPLYPKIKITGNAQSTSLTIGKEVVRFRDLNGIYIMECLSRHQDFTLENGTRKNSLMIGDFFKIPPGQHGVVLASGISRVEILLRKAELA